MRKAFSWIVLAYVSGAVLGVAAGYLARIQHSLLVAAIADLAATLVVFAFSYSLGNSSIYDSYPLAPKTDRRRSE